MADALRDSTKLLVPATPTSVYPAPRPAQPVWRLALGAGVGAVAVVEVLGFVACRLFDVALRVDSDLAAGPVDFFETGINALLPLVAVWILASVVVGSLMALAPLLGKPIAGLFARWPRPKLDPVARATVVVLAGVAGWAVIYRTFSDVFNAVAALISAQIPSSVDGSVFGPPRMKFHEAHDFSTAILVFLLGFAVIRWFPGWERAAKDSSVVRMLKWATVAVAFVALASTTMTRRLIWEDFPEVLFEDRPAHVIAERGGELLLFKAGGSQPNHRVRTDSPSLQRLGQKSVLFGH
jgi:hypothetical protein